MTMSDNASQPDAGTPVPAPDSPSDATESPEVPPVPGAGAESTETSAGAGEHPDDVKWRQRYRQAETQLIVEQARTADLGDRIAAMQRAEAERLVAVSLEDPSDLWRAGAELADLLNDAGELDLELVEAAAQATLEDHPHWRRTVPVKLGPPASVVTSDGRIPSGPTQPTWAELLGGKTGA